MAQKKKINSGYSEEFQAMLDRLQKEDEAYEQEEEEEMMINNNGGYYSHSNMMMRKNRLSNQQVKALEIHFEEDNKLQPERKLKIAQELGLEPRQVAVWFQNRRARWKAKQIEREYDQLRASYDALKHDYGSLQHEKSRLLSQLEDLKAKIEAKTSTNNATLSMSTQINSIDVMNESSCQNMSLATFSSSSPHQEVLDPSSSSSSTLNGYRLLKAYQNQRLVRMEDLGMLNNEELCNFFSIDHAPTLHWHQGDQFN